MQRTNDDGLVGRDAARPERRRRRAVPLADHTRRVARRVTTRADGGFIVPDATRPERRRHAVSLADHTRSLEVDATMKPTRADGARPFPTARAAVAHAAKSTMEEAEDSATVVRVPTLEAAAEARPGKGNNALVAVHWASEAESTNPAPGLPEKGEAHAPGWYVGRAQPLLRRVVFKGAREGSKPMVVEMELEPADYCPQKLVDASRGVPEGAWCYVI